MWKKTVNFFLFTAFCFLLYLVLRLLISLLGFYDYRYFHALVYSVVFFFFLLGITYGWLWKKRTINTRNKKILLLCVCVMFSTVIIPVFIIGVNYVNGLYEYVSSDNVNGFSGNQFEADDSLGYKHVPNSLGKQTIRNGRTTFMHSSKEGFRIPVSDSTSLNVCGKADVIFLGCSYTYGHGINAEESFPYLVAKQNHLGYINAGVCGYGLSQMYVLANKLIPKYKPKYVVIQYSPWLIQRSTDLFDNSYLGLIPIPSFHSRGEDVIMLLPIFKRRFYYDKSLLREKYQHKYFKFVFNVGIPCFSSECYNYTSIRFKQALNPLLRPPKDVDAVEKYIYNEMVKVAIENGAQVIMLNLGDKEYSKRSKLLLDKRYQVSFAEGDSMLYSFVGTSRSMDYKKEFWQMGYDGKDSILVDSHPNAKAHNIIAKSILLKIK